MFTKTRTGKAISIMLVVAVCVAAMAVTAFAGNSFTGYSTTVGKFNGNGYSASQVKATSGANGRIISSTVGGNYTVDVRMQKLDGSASGAWYRGLNDGTDTGFALDGHSEQRYGDNVRLNFSNNLTTTVDVQVSGQWTSQ